MVASERSLLVVGPSWVGDMVMAQALFIALKREDPGRAIDVVAPPAALSLASRMPEVREAYALSVAHGRLGLPARFAMARRLKRNAYDRAIVVPSSFKSALLPWLARIPLRTGYRGEARFGLINDVRASPDVASEQNVRGYLGLGPPESNGSGDVPRPMLRVDRENGQRLLAKLGLTMDAPVVALAPGAAGGSAKRWPVEHFAELARRLTAEGIALWVIGGQDDRPLASQVLEGAKSSAHNLCGRTSLPDVVDLLDLVTVLVANDSGLLHLGAAAGARVVGLYGPTSPTFAPPLTDDADILYRALECSPCFARECPLGHHRCLKDITVDDVLARVLVSAKGS